MFELRWERPLHQRPAAADIAVSDGDVLVHERSTRLVRLSGSDGAVRWDVPLGTWPRAVVLDGSDVVALPQQPGRLFCLSWADGLPHWTNDVGWLSGHVVVSPEVVLVGGWRGYTPLRGLSRSTGELLWTRSRVTVLPAWFAGGFLVGEPRGAGVELLHPGTGEPTRTWRTHVPNADAEPVFEVIDESHALVSGQPLNSGSRRTRPSVPRPTSGERLAGSLALPGTEITVTLDRAGHLEHWSPDGTRLGRVRVARRAEDLRVLGPDRIVVAAKGTIAVYGVG
ncbi:hypothetical protein [Amycolatopsis sp. NPDC051372]|uniref:hypothetical protein n=1 Tax=Amycolatopsis sp. NPDC051372 TaxID=3155669 RepID=UPI00343D5C65